MTAPDATVRLERTADRAAQIEALSADHGVRVGLDAVLDDLNREAVRQIVPVSAADWGFRWNDGDCDTEEWWPQGITTSADASGDDEAHGRRLVVVSWYAKPVGDALSRGARLSFVDITSTVAAPRYRHVLLVQPAHDAQANTWSLQPVRSHAGGIGWHGGTVYVADTKRGIRCFDLSDIVRVTGDDDGYRYVLPQRTYYKAVNDDGAEPFRFSFVALDRASTPHRLVVGEYGRGEQTTRIAAFDLMLDDTSSSPSEWLERGPTNMQGVVVVDGLFYAAASRGERRRGTMWTFAAGQRPREHQATLAVGPEDLSYWPLRDEIWGLSEHPGRRYVYAMPRSAFLVVS